MKRILTLLALFFSLGLVVVLWSPWNHKQDQRFTASFLDSPSVPKGFARVDGSKELVFPDDFGPHPTYQTEWWYYTGNLKTADGHHFGYQLTFFRRGLLPPQDWVQRESAWATNQIYMAHFAISDVEAKKHQAYERFSRDGLGLAGAQAGPFTVWLEDWRVEQRTNNQYQMVASQDTLQLNLTLTDTKGPILHGEHGYSLKGSDPGNASYYFSQTRLASSGTIRIEDAVYAVQGWSWMDHEFSTSALSTDQIGWDWFSIQLEEGTDLMVFQIRREDLSIDPFSSGTLVTPTGETLGLKLNDFEILVENIWRSPFSGTDYPSRWRLRVPSQGLELVIEPLLADQEMDLSFTYWEGAVWVSGLKDGEPVSGTGYVELTGYAQSMEGEF